MAHIFNKKMKLNPTFIFNFAILLILSEFLIADDPDTDNDFPNCIYSDFCQKHLNNSICNWKTKKCQCSVEFKQMRKQQSSMTSSKNYISFYCKRYYCDSEKPCQFNHGLTCNLNLNICECNFGKSDDGTGLCEGTKISTFPKNVVYYISAVVFVFAFLFCCILPCSIEYCRRKCIQAKRIKFKTNVENELYLNEKNVTTVSEIVR